MIGKLKGLVDSQGEDWVILDVQGVGYEIACSSRTLQNLPAKGEAASLSIETYVREDAIKLFGFANEQERVWFRLLMTVQGVGAKVALAVLSTLSVSELADALTLGDKTMIARTPGIGPKVAQRMIAELKDKVPAFASPDAGLAGLGAAMAAPEAGASSAVMDAVSALTNLGYPQNQATSAVAMAAKADGEAGAETLIRLALKELAK